MGLSFNFLNSELQNQNPSQPQNWEELDVMFSKPNFKIQLQHHCNKQKKSLPTPYTSVCVRLNISGEMRNAILVFFFLIKTQISPKYFILKYIYQQ